MIEDDLSASELGYVAPTPEGKHVVTDMAIDKFREWAD